MSNLVEDYLKMAKKKRITNYKSSGKMSIYKDVLLINFTKSVQARQDKRLNRKRRRTFSEISRTEMVKRMKKIDEELAEWKVEDKKIEKPLPLKKSAKPKIEEQEVKEISEPLKNVEESEDIWEDARENFKEPTEEKAFSTFSNIFMKVIKNNKTTGHNYLSQEYTNLLLSRREGAEVSMSSNLVKDYLKMAVKKRIVNYKKSEKMSYYRDALLINFTKSIQERQKRLNRKRRRTVSETPEATKDMVKRMKRINEEMKVWEIKDEKIKEPLPLKKSTEAKIEEQEVKEISEPMENKKESEDVWEDAKEDFEEPAEEQGYSTFYNIFMKVVSFLHF
ncbi:unnamed protein product [Caenorhabditis brenneri]